MRDGNILQVDPEEAVIYVAVPFWKWFDDLPSA